MSKRFLMNYFASSSRLGNLTMCIGSINCHCCFINLVGTKTINEIIHLFQVLPLILSTSAIKVPVEGKENSTQNAPENTADKKQDTFYISDDANVDSYLIPPDPHRPEDVIYDISETPATYLLPPSPEKQIDYYAPTEAGEQTDWYPIAQQAPVRSLPHQQPEQIPILLHDQSFGNENVRGGKALKSERVSPPSRHLEVPFENGPNDYVIKVPSEELELPAEEADQPFRNPASDYKPPSIKKPKRKHNLKKTFSQLKAVEPTLALHLTPPKPLPTKYKNPTKLYPKKVTKGFQPIPIPIAHFAEDTLIDVPRAKPVKPFKPILSAESEYFTPPDEKKIYLYEQAEQKRNLKGENNNPVEVCLLIYLQSNVSIWKKQLNFPKYVQVSNRNISFSAGAAGRRGRGHIWR